jgi:hypothetical protein
VVISADVKRVDGEFRVFAKGGREDTGMEAIGWIARCVENGAGEVVLNSIDTDGVKGGFDLYFTPEVQDEAVTLTISIQTEKKTKTKHYTVNPLTEREREAEKEHRYKRLHFGGSGRRFRLIIETEAGVTAPWRLIGGIQMIVETDSD